MSLHSHPPPFIRRVIAEQKASSFDLCNKRMRRNWTGSTRDWRNGQWRRITRGIANGENRVDYGGLHISHPYYLRSNG